MHITEEVRDRVVLVGLNSPVLKREETADEETMAELAALVDLILAGTVLLGWGAGWGVYALHRYRKNHMEKRTGE